MKTTSPEETLKKFVDESQEDYERFRSDRKDIDDACEVADGMYKCMQNRTLAASEISKGTAIENDTRANVGSTIFYRQVNQMASILAGMMIGAQRPFSFEPIQVEGLWGSVEDGNEMAAQYNALALWTMKKDDFKAKLIDLSHQIFKYTNQPVQIVQRKREVRRMIKQQDGTKEWRDITVDNYPSLVILPWSMVYADRYANGNLPDHNCVILLSLRTKTELWSSVKTANFELEAIEDVFNDFDKYCWDQSEGADFKEKQDENQNRDYSPGKSNLVLQWDVYRRCPVGEDMLWDDTQPDDLFLGTIIGNTIRDGKVVRFRRDIDPDGEIPLLMLHAVPDDCDALYHTMMSELVRSAYSTVCTLLDLAIDNMARANEPPLKHIPGAHMVKDFRQRRGAQWAVNNMGAIEEFVTRDNTQSTVQLLKYVTEEEIMRAFATDINLMGMSHGARTSASEAIKIERHSMETRLVQSRYVIGQLIPWYARKMKSFWDAYADEGQVISITDEEQHVSVHPQNLYGEFDVVIDVADEYEQDVLQVQKLQSAITMISQSPQLMQSATHRVDAGALVRSIFERWGIKDTAKIVLPRGGYDAAKVARMENDLMMQDQKSVSPSPEEDHPSHMAEHRGERIRFQGVEAEYPQLALLDQHIAETEYLISQQEQNARTPMTGNDNQTEGEAVGNEMAGALAGGVA